MLDVVSRGYRQLLCTLSKDVPAALAPVLDESTVAALTGHGWSVLGMLDVHWDRRPGVPFAERRWQAVYLVECSSCGAVAEFDPSALPAGDRQAVDAFLACSGCVLVATYAELGWTFLEGPAGASKVRASHACGTVVEAVAGTWVCPGCHAPAHGGYDASKPGALYCVSGRGITKVGVSNVGNVRSRLRRHQAQGLTEIVLLKEWPNGRMATRWEARWLELLERRAHARTSRTDLEDGFTEGVFASVSDDWVAGFLAAVA